VNHGSILWWNLTERMENNKEAKGKSWIKLVTERAHLDAECTDVPVEQEADWCQEVICSSLNATPKTIQIWARSQSRWNADIKERQKAVRREQKT